MFQEAAQSADVVQDQLDRSTRQIEQIGEKLRRLGPRMVVTCARGSSDHAATFAKYLLESRTGLFTASAAPSINSIYETDMNFSGAVCLVISQSGASPDILSVAEAAKRNGAYVIAMVNRPESPLARLADDTLELLAGRENSVAATKSFIASLASLIQLVAAWRRDSELKNALAEAPALLRQAWNCGWDAALEALTNTTNLFVLGRGMGLGIAQEAALKFKEACGIHAEAYSAAEVLHGPITMAGPSFPVMVFAQNDASRPGVEDLVRKLAERNVPLITAGISHDLAINLPTPAGHAVIEPLLRIQSFYRLVNDLSLRLRLNPDCPPNLRKVTATV